MACIPGARTRDPSVVRASLLLLLVLTAPPRAADAAEPEPPAPGEATLRVMTFNIRYANPHDGLDQWPYRAHLVASTIRFHGIDVCGVQEALGVQVESLRRRLPGYGIFGVGRDPGGGGERCAILVRESRVEVLRTATFWLSPRPEHPGKAWDAALPRIVTWGELRDRHTGQQFFLFNTHFDHRGRRARLESAHLLLRQVRTIAGAAPVIVLGDFNADTRSQPYRVLIGEDASTPGADQARLRDALHLAEQGHFGPPGTFAGFGGVARSGPKIDHILVGGAVRVLAHGILAQAWHEGRTASDHRPVLVEVRPGESPRLEQLELHHGWRFAPDPDGQGVERGWHRDPLDDSDWAILQAGEPWERQGFADLDGEAFFRRHVVIPAEWRDRAIRLELNGVDDGFTLWVNGRELITLGGEGDSCRDRRVVLELPGEALHPGQRNLVVFRVLDAPDAPGAGGLTGLPLLLGIRPQPVTHQILTE